MNKKIIVFLGICLLFILGVAFGWYYFGEKNNLDSAKEYDYVILDKLSGLSLEEVEKYALDKDIKLNISYEYSLDISENVVISQGIEEGTLIDKGGEVSVVISKGVVPSEVYKDNEVNELGSVPIMMYHGIVNISSDETLYTGGNVDEDGYNRTAEAFREDLEFYYKRGYRMIKLSDYVDGKIDVEMGKSPIILTFDDGNENNFKVLGEKDGELIIDPDCAVGILEEFKKKYPDYGVTATFFVNSGLFNQDEYNEKILKWLVDNGYDVGNHTMTHVDFKTIGIEEVKKEVGGLYQILDNIIPSKYVKIIALPFGSPYSRNHSNYESILNGNYLGVDYQTKAALRVGWEAEVSCFDKAFDPTYLKRIRAYDNKGVDFDIDMNFRILESKKYVSDGDVNTIVVREEDKDAVSDNLGNLKVVTY